MVENLCKLQQGLGQEYRTEGAMYNRVVPACRTTIQCSIAILQQAFTLPALIDNIYAALQNNFELENNSENCHIVIYNSVPKALEINQGLADRAAFHAISKLVPAAENFLITGRYSSEKFYGIMLDTGATLL
ncbi:hypothetical protein GcC1_047009 [Golovinomyces cichoracearum]|uniref:Uncharacterized protein n=1 Tax=Golovinomyces cichoracearum TaxID=62708 RepID=A0A420IXS3_9PEZI|nr:hypothetical protein GcC1_047009 [Golovinomyces cichoracearum]